MMLQQLQRIEWHVLCWQFYQHQIHLKFILKSLSWNNILSKELTIQNARFFERTSSPQWQIVRNGRLFEIFNSTQGPISRLKIGLVLTSNQHRLIFTISQHIVVSIVRNGVDVRRHFSFSFVLITDNNMVVIYWKPLVRINCDTEKTGIGVD